MSLDNDDDRKHGYVNPTEIVDEKSQYILKNAKYAVDNMIAKIMSSPENMTKERAADAVKKVGLAVVMAVQCFDAAKHLESITGKTADIAPSTARLSSAESVSAGLPDPSEEQGCSSWFRSFTENAKSSDEMHGDMTSRVPLEAVEEQLSLHSPTSETNTASTFCQREAVHQLKELPRKEQTQQLTSSLTSVLAHQSFLSKSTSSVGNRQAPAKSSHSGEEKPLGNRQAQWERRYKVLETIDVYKFDAALLWNVSKTYRKATLKEGELGRVPYPSIVGPVFLQAKIKKIHKRAKKVTVIFDSPPCGATKHKIYSYSLSFLLSYFKQIEDEPFIYSE